MEKNMAKGTSLTEKLDALYEFDREPVSEKKLQGLKELHKIKLPYLGNVDKKTMKKVENLYYLNLFREYLFCGEKKEARRYLLKAFIARTFSAANFIETLALILDYKKLERLKSYLHIIKENVK